MLEQTTDDFRESVCKNVKTSLKQVQKDVDSLKSWIRNQPHLPQCSTDTLLTSFIIGCKNDMELAKRKLENYYTIRARIPDFFSERDPATEGLQEVSRHMQVFYVPKMTPDGCRVQIVSFASKDASKFNYTTSLKRNLMLEDVKMHREAFSNGTFVIVDLTNFTASHVLQLTPKACKDIFYCAQDVLPILMKRIIVINAPAFMNIIMNIVKPFMKKKLFQRFCIHTEGCEVLDRFLPRALLPKDYGGDEATSQQINVLFCNRFNYNSPSHSLPEAVQVYVKNKTNNVDCKEDWMRCLEANRDWLMNEGSMTTDETKRVKSKPLLGNMEALTAKEIKSFKHLCID